MKIGNRLVGYGQPTFVIAELCSNVIRYVKDLRTVIDAVKRTGANACKVQLFRHTHFPQPEWRQKKLVEFPRDRFPEFVELCHKNALLAGASVFDDDAVTLLETSDADYIKMATREWENVNLWERVLLSSLPKIASWDYSVYPELPYADHTIHLACLPKYPSIDPQVPDYGKKDWGWSSHSRDWLYCLVAVSHGACVVEKHFAMSETDFERGWSLESNEFAEMVKDIRRVERMR